MLCRRFQFLHCCTTQFNAIFLVSVSISMDASTSTHSLSILVAVYSLRSWLIVPSWESFVPSWASFVIISSRFWRIFTYWFEVKPVVYVEMSNSFPNISMLLTHRKYLVYALWSFLYSSYPLPLILATNYNTRLDNRLSSKPPYRDKIWSIMFIYFKSFFRLLLTFVILGMILSTLDECKRCSV